MIEIDYCPTCGKPGHANDTTDAGEHAECYRERVRDALSRISLANMRGDAIDQGDQSLVDDYFVTFGDLPYHGVARRDTPSGVEYAWCDDPDPSTYVRRSVASGEVIA